MKWKSTLLWFLVCCLGYTTTLPVDGNKPLDIWCLDDYVRAQDDLMENVGNDIQNCESKESCQTKEVRKSQACATARRCKPEQVHVDGMCFKPETRKRPRKTFKETTTSVPPLSVTWTFKSPHLIVAVTGGSVVIAALVFLYLWFYRKKFCAAYTDTPLERKKTRILLVCTIDNGFVDAINQLIEMIMKIANIEVTCNLRKKTEIGMHGIQEWTKKEVGNSDITCVVVANRYETMKLDMEENETSRLDDVEKHQIAIVIAAIETMIVNNAFENTMKKFIVLDLSNCVDKESLPYFTRYKLPSDLKKFMKSIPSKMTKSQKMKIDKEQKIFLNLLSNAQLGYSHTFQTYDDEEKIAVSDSECSQSGQANDFDDIEKEETSLDVGDSLHGNAISLNIVPSAPHSHECNTKMYETTDYNHRSVIEQQRFIQSGARPKQTNC